MSRTVCKTIALAIAMFMTYVGSARGAGLELYETGYLGTASAGRAALASDASTAGTNPAGMTLLDRTQLMTAPGALLPSTNFDVAPQTTTSGGGGGNAGVFFPIGSFYYVNKISERVRFGVSIFSDYGLGGDYGKTWVGRYYATEESLITGKVDPSIAYEVNDWLSVGTGVSFGVGRLTFQSKINNALPRVSDGGLSFESWDEAFGANVGILLRPIAKLRIGLTYQSPEDYKFGFRPHITGLGPGLGHLRRRIGGVKANIPLTEPQQVMLSGVYEVLPKWSLMADVGWQNWSAFGSFPVGISSAKQTTTVDANLHFSDTCHVAIGQQFRFDEKWLWSAGFAYDSSPVSKANRSAVLPLDRQLRYGTGLQYDINNSVTAGASWELMDAGPGPYSNRRGPLAGTLQGHYSTNWLNFAALNIIWKF
ncbi:OmpP1/FadL family transporter [Candidatus Binatus sp.]|uniref:OmpP1/FadL family transporter n=1 Tax=Candidatus Binatus sp. TaxID=2811406 RepID=UPI003CC50701